MVIKFVIIATIERIPLERESLNARADLEDVCSEKLL